MGKIVLIIGILFATLAIFIYIKSNSISDQIDQNLESQPQTDTTQIFSSSSFNSSPPELTEGFELYDNTYDCTEIEYLPLSNWEVQIPTTNSITIECTELINHRYYYLSILRDNVYLYFNPFKNTTYKEGQSYEEMISNPEIKNLIFKDTEDVTIKSKLIDINGMIIQRYSVKFNEDNKIRYLYPIHNTKSENSILITVVAPYYADNPNQPQWGDLDMLISTFRYK